MATPTYDLLDSTTLASAASSVTFTGIDQSYGDLVLVAESKNTGTGAYMTMKLNNDTGSNYNQIFADGNGSSAQSISYSNQSIAYLQGVDPMSNTDSNLTVLQFLDYSATNKHKSILHRDNRANALVYMQAIRYASNSALTTIEIAVNSNSFASGSTFYLYGIAK